MTDPARGDDPASEIPGQPRTARSEPVWAAGLRLLRWLLGALTLVGGLTWILLNLNAPSALSDIVAGCVLAAGGLVLLMPHRISLPGTATAVTMPITALVGTATGLLTTTERRGDVAYIVEHGWPFHWVQRGVVADDPDTAYRLAQSADWHVDLIALAGDLLVFAYAGMLVVVTAVLIRSVRRS
jgi:hypothetical protein